jgi:type I restriction enzyme S subunit
MMKTNNIPKLRFPEFNGNWNKIQLNQLLDFKNGINASKEQYGKGVKFINVLDILNNDYITSDNIIGRVDVDEKTISKYLVGYGDILFQRSSETREEVGTANVYLDKNQTAVFGGFVIRGAKIGDYEPVFFNKLLKTDLARNEITSRSGGSTRYNVGQDILSNISLPFPSLPEQQKVASFLTTVDDKISNLKQKVSLLEKYKKGVMQQIFSQQIRFKDTAGNDYPDWEEIKLGDFAKITTGSSNREDSNLDGEYTFFDRSQDIRSSNRYLFDAEAIIVPGEGKEFIPKYFKGKFDLHQRTYAIMNFGENNGLFLFNSITYHKNHLDSYAVGSTVKSLRLPMFESMPIKLPCIEEQTKIAEFLSCIDDKIETTKLQLSKMEVWKKGLLQGMFC